MRSCDCPKDENLRWILLPLMLNNVFSLVSNVSRSSGKKYNFPFPIEYTKYISSTSTTVSKARANHSLASPSFISIAPKLSITRSSHQSKGSSWFVRVVDIVRFSGQVVRIETTSRSIVDWASDILGSDSAHDTLPSDFLPAMPQGSHRSSANCVIDIFLSTCFCF